MAYFEKYIYPANEEGGNYLLHAGATDFEGDLSAELYTIKMPIVGSEFYQLNGRRLKVSNDQFLLTNPDDEVAGQVRSEKMVEGLYAGLSKHFVRGVAASMSDKELNLVDDLSATCPVRLVDDSYQCAYSRTGRFLATHLPAYQERHLQSLYKDHFFLALAEELLKDQTNIRADLRSLSQVKIATRKELLKRVYLMDEYIREYYLEDISLDRLSLIAGLSKYHAIRCYQSIFDISPYQKILALRLEKGRDLLSKGTPITLTAQLTNFTDRRAFTKSFKKRFGMSPSEFAGRK